MPARGPLAIDALHVINLERRPERMRRFVNRVRNELEWTVPIVRHRAIDTTDWSVSARDAERGASFATYVLPAQLPVIARGFRTAEEQLSRGAVGCTLSHMALWTFLAAHRDLEYLAIFEDDAAWSLETHPTLEEMLAMLEAHITNDWDILSLGAQHVEVACDHGFYSELKRYWATHAYIVHRTAVPKLLRAMLPMGQQLDAALSQKTGTDGLKVVSPNRVLFWQQAPESDVQVPMHRADGTIHYSNGTYLGTDGILRLLNGTVVGKPE